MMNRKHIDAHNLSSGDSHISTILTMFIYIQMIGVFLYDRI